jgi:dihydroorotase-like cyclic amidohydrolase
LIEEGITSFKLFLNNTDESAQRKGYKATNFGFAYKAMEIIAAYGPPAILQAHCEQPDIFNLLTNRLEAEGRNDFLAWSEARPDICETMHA